MEKIQSQDPGSSMNIPDLIFERLGSVFGLKILQFFDADTDPGSCQPWVRDGKYRIRDKHPGSATLILPDTNFLGNCFEKTSKRKFFL
jgi:hypothetical protein